MITLIVAAAVGYLVVGSVGTGLVARALIKPYNDDDVTVIVASGVFWPLVLLSTGVHYLHCKARDGFNQQAQLPEARVIK